MQVESAPHNTTFGDRSAYPFRLNRDVVGFPISGVVIPGTRSLSSPTTYVFPTFNGRFTQDHAERIMPYTTLNPEGDTVGFNIPHVPRLPPSTLIKMMVPNGKDKLRHVSASIGKIPHENEKLIVAGASSGGRWAASYAAQWPNQVDKLIVVDPPGVLSLPSLAMLERVRKSEQQSKSNINRHTVWQFAKWFPGMFLQHDPLGRFYGVQYAKFTLFDDFIKVLDGNPQAHIYYFTGTESLINNHAMSSALIQNLFKLGQWEEKDYFSRFHHIPKEGYDHRRMCDPPELTEMFKMIGV